MRLIDADELTKDLIENKNFYPAIVKRAIEEAPTVQATGEWISVEEGLPDEEEFVLVWCGKEEIARIRKGITEEQRQKMRNGELPNPDELCFDYTNGYHHIKRSEVIKPCDLWGNNLVPYCWEIQGNLNSIFGQDVYYWMPRPQPPQKKGN